MELVNHLGRICYSIIVLLEIKRRIDRNLLEIKVVTKINEEIGRRRRSHENSDNNTNTARGNDSVEDSPD